MFFLLGMVVADCDWLASGNSGSEHWRVGCAFPRILSEGSPSPVPTTTPPRFRPLPARPPPAGAHHRPFPISPAFDPGLSRAPHSRGSSPAAGWEPAAAPTPPGSCQPPGMLSRGGGGVGSCREILFDRSCPPRTCQGVLSSRNCQVTTSFHPPSSTFQQEILHIIREGGGFKPFFLSEAFLWPPDPLGPGGNRKAPTQGHHHQNLSARERWGGGVVPGPIHGRTHHRCSRSAAPTAPVGPFVPSPHRLFAPSPLSAPPSVCRGPSR